MSVTVIVTVYNIEKYLPRFFKSMQEQTFTDYCLLMVDDGSTDGSLKICKQYALNDDRIKIIELEHVGIAKARNIALEHIDTEYVTSADGDDYVERDYLKHLMDALLKYNADLSISRVVYRLEKDNIIEGCFPERGELFIPREEFSQKLPMLVSDRRLNYLYGKMYRASLLKDIRVEDDVRQGSDTMINCQYLANAQSIVLIDDLDYNYIKYKSRSVTSYSGGDAYRRICRINQYLFAHMEKNGWMTEEMYRVIDGRILLSAIWCIERIYETVNDDTVKADGITQILSHPLYLQAYSRQETSGKYSFAPIAPQNGNRYVKRRKKQKKQQERKGRIVSKCPPFILKIYRTFKKKN